MNHLQLPPRRRLSWLRRSGTVGAMQTFLPFADFARSAEVLDDRRLGKQRVETLQILRALHCEDYGWGRHPAVTMWQGHTQALVSYGMAMVTAWQERGYGDTTRDNIAEFAHPHDPRSQKDLATDGLLPGWVGWEPLHRSHRSALLRKNPAHYSERFPTGTPHDLEYVWPESAVRQPAHGSRSAWVVRGTIHGDYVVVAAEPGEVAERDHWIPLDARSGRVTKRTRQVARLIDEMTPGDLLVVPRGECLSVGQITGDHRIDDGAHQRPVRWLGEVERACLAFPAALQDPQSVFSLYDEPVLFTLARSAS